MNAKTLLMGAVLMITSALIFKDGNAYWSGTILAFIGLSIIEEK